MSVKEQRSIAQKLAREPTSARNLKPELSRLNSTADSLFKEWSVKYRKAIKKRENAEREAHQRSMFKYLHRVSDKKSVKYRDGNLIDKIELVKPPTKRTFITRGIDDLGQLNLLQEEIRNKKEQIAQCKRVLLSADGSTAVRNENFKRESPSKQTNLTDSKTSNVPMKITPGIGLNTQSPFEQTPKAAELCATNQSKSREALKEVQLYHSTQPNKRAKLTIRELESKKENFIPKYAMNETPAGRPSIIAQDAKLQFKRAAKVEKKDNERMRNLTLKKEDRAYLLNNKLDVTPQLLNSKGNQESRGDFLEVSIPGDTIEIFLKAASKNTMRNLETCGILVGTRIGDVKVVSTLYIPKQTGTYEDCKINEEEFPHEELFNSGL